MKKYLLFVFSVLLLIGCKVGTYSLASGKPDMAMVSFTALKKNSIVVEIDGQDYHVKTVKTKDYHVNRNIKATALNVIKIPAGKHAIRVIQNGKEVFNGKLVLAASEHRIIEL